MNTTARPLVVLGEHDSKGVGLRYAQQLAVPEQHPVITVVDVNEFLENYVDVLRDVIDGNELRQLVLEQRREQLMRLIHSCRSSDCGYARAEVLEGTPFIEIIRECMRSNNDMIIKVAENWKGAHGTGFASTDLHLIRKSPQPVMIIDPAAQGTSDSVLVAVDVANPRMRPLNELLVGRAALVANRFDCDLHLLTTWQLRGESVMRHNPLLRIDDARIGRLHSKLLASAEKQMDALARRVRRITQMRRNPIVHIIKGAPETVVPEFVDRHAIGLLMLSTATHADIPGLFIGTTAESILNRVRCSILAVKPEGFVSPITLMPEHNDLAVASGLTHRSATG